MAGKDSDQNYHPQESEISSKPKWVTLRRKMFREDTVGYALFPEILEGRDRPETMFNQPVKSLWIASAKAVSELEDIGIATIGDMMNMDQDEFKSLSKKHEIKERVENHLRDQAITPHARLLQTVHGEIQSPVPSHREKEIIEAVEKMISTFRSEENPSLTRDERVIRLRFGLDDGIKHSLDAIGKSDPWNPVSRNRVLQIEKKALRRLRIPGRARITIDFLTVPQNCMARKVFGAVFEKDLSLIDLERMSLSGDTRNELSENSLYIPRRNFETKRYSAGNILVEDLSIYNLSETARAEIESELKCLAKEEQEKATQKSAEVFVEHKKEEKLEPVVNNLLPEVELTEEELNALRDVPIENLDLSFRTYHSLKRSRVERLGVIMESGRMDLLNIRNFGSRNLRELGEKLEQFLNFPEERVAKGEIARLFDPDVVSESSKYEIVSTQTPDARDMYEDHSLQTIRLMVRSALNEGCIFSKDIQDWIVKSGKNVGFNPGGEITLALIEYAISHPRKTEK